MTRRIAAALALVALILAVLALLVTLQRHRDAARQGTSVTVVSEQDAELPVPGSR